MCKIIAIANQKGGVGKTTTTGNLGIGLARQGKRVLLIDADAQGSLTASLGYAQPDKLEVTLTNVMDRAINEDEFEPEYGVLHHEEGVDLIPGNIELAGLEVALVNELSRERILRNYTEMVKDRYDYILIDCMPSLGILTINAFACADSVLIPVQAAYLPVKGLEQLIRTIGKVKRQINPSLAIEGILLTISSEEAGRGIVAVKGDKQSIQMGQFHHRTYSLQIRVSGAYGELQDGEAFQGQEKSLCTERPVAYIREHTRSNHRRGDI